MKKIFNIKKILPVIILIMMITYSLSAQYSGGTGSETDPYQIASLENLGTLSMTVSDWNEHFILMADINASATIDWNGGKGFSPIGQSDTAFTGSFDGRGFTISGLYIKRSQTMYNGLFGKASGAVIKNLNLNDFYVEGGNFTGCLVGQCWGSNTIGTDISNINLTNCQIKGGPFLGSVAGEILNASIDNCKAGVIILGGFGMMGGIAGYFDSYGDKVIKNCSVTVEFNELSHVSGGLIGSNHSLIKDCNAIIQAEGVINLYGSIGGFAGQNLGTIENCLASGGINVTGSNSEWIGGLVGNNNGTLTDSRSSVCVDIEHGTVVGGLVGENSGIIINCYSSGSVKGSNQVASLVGLNMANSEITNCYASGSVSGEETVGGFLGQNDDNTTVINCYATGVVSGSDITGGFVGENNYLANITNCYSSGRVMSEGSFSGGFAGLNRSSGNTYNCFFDIETTGKTIGIGMDYNGSNSQPVDLITSEFFIKNIFLDAGWSFGNSDQSPWKMGTAPDSLKRPVLFYHNYLVMFLANEGGVVGPDSLLEQTINCGGNSDTVFAIPYEFYYFAKWQNSAGDSISNSNPMAIEDVNSDSTLVAVFHSTFSIDEIPARYVNIYPNPVDEVLHIELDGKFILLNTIIELYDINGKLRLKLHPTSESSHINTKNLNNGLYLVKIQEDKNIFTKKVVIQ